MVLVRALLVVPSFSLRGEQGTGGPLGSAVLSAFLVALSEFRELLSLASCHEILPWGGNILFVTCRCSESKYALLLPGFPLFSPLPH